jgi:NADPH2:quinone reductase
VRALVVNSSTPERIGIREVPDPTPNPGEILVDVHTISLNRGELTRTGAAPDGWRPGWDFAGIVVRPGSPDLPEGTRVVGLLDGGAWAERVAAPTTWLAPLPERVTFTQAAALPVAGLTALRILRLTPAILGRRLLVTGAAGGVGRFAVQLAHLGGARVTAIVRSPDRAAGLRELGVDEIVTHVDDLQGRDLILESVGGESLARLVTEVDPDGTLVMFGNTSNQPTTFDVRDVYLGGAVRLQSFMLFHDLPGGPPGRDLSYLAQLLAAGRLDPQVGAELSWGDIADAPARLRERSILGKVVLTVR